MSVARAQIQTVEEIYRLVWGCRGEQAADEAAYQGPFRLFCPHRLGRNCEGQLRVLCYQYGGDAKAVFSIGFAGELALYCA